MIKAIVFDCYGVIVGRGFSYTYRLAGGDADKDADFIHDILDRASAGTLAHEAFVLAVTQKIGISEDRWLEAVRRTQTPNQDLLAYIAQELKGTYKVSILSNAGKGSLEQKIPAEQRAIFDDIVVSAEVGCIKPQREIFELAASRLGVAFNEMIFIDDYPQYVDAAQSYGISSILYTGFEDLKHALPVLLDTPS